MCGISGTYVWYDIYLLQLGLHLVAAVGRLVQKKERQLCARGETVHKTVQKHRIHEIENKKQRILKNVSRVIRRQQRKANNNDTTYCTDKLH